MKGVAVALCLVLSAGLPAFADPPAPEGWRETAAGTGRLYSLKSDNAVSLRLDAEETSPATLARWFASKLDEPVSGRATVSFDEPSTTPQGATMAVGLGGAPGAERIYIAMGCETASKKRRFAMLQAPPDLDLVERLSRDAAQIVALACAEAPATDTRLTPAAGAKPAPPSTGVTVTEAAPPKTASPAAAALPKGTGLASRDIKGVLYSWLQTYGVYGVEYREWTYLLLADGTARRGVPQAAPADFDVAADRRANPGDWGRWKQAGGKYLVDFGEGFEDPPGQMLRQPGKPGERLSGKFQNSNSVVVGSTSAWSNWGLLLTKDGRFRRWDGGGMGGTSGYGDSAVWGMVTRDNKGASSSVGGRNVGGGSSSSTGVTDADLAGTYHIDGWSMELRYDSGAVQRGFFFTSAERDTIWFEGNELFISSFD